MAGRLRASFISALRTGRARIEDGKRRCWMFFWLLPGQVLASTLLDDYRGIINELAAAHACGAHTPTGSVQLSVRV